jgi:hypothetical protein
MKRFFKLLIAQAFMVVIGPKMFYQSIFVLRFLLTTVTNFLPVMIPGRRRMTPRRISKQVDY